MKKFILNVTTNFSSLLWPIIYGFEVTENYHYYLEELYKKSVIIKQDHQSKWLEHTDCMARVQSLIEISKKTLI